jgi:hypothetical protein
MPADDQENGSSSAELQLARANPKSDAGEATSKTYIANPPLPLDERAGEVWQSALDRFAERLWADVIELESEVNGGSGSERRGLEVTSGMIEKAYVAQRQPQAPEAGVRTKGLSTIARVVALSLANVLAGFFANQTDSVVGIVGLVVSACAAVALATYESVRR